MSHIARRAASSLRASSATSTLFRQHGGNGHAVFRCLSSTSTRRSDVGTQNTISGASEDSKSIPTPSTSQKAAPSEDAIVASYMRNRRTFEERMEEVETLTSQFGTHLKGVFPDLDFPPELAQRILTHGGHVTAAAKGHNAGLSFVGRRVLSAYMQLFLTSCKIRTQPDLEAVEHATLETRFLGQHAGSAWGFGRILVWEHARALSEMRLSDPKDARRAGLWKASGTAVEALVGGIYHQWGATVAHRFFHTRLLPLLLVPGGLPQEFHEQAEAICEKMGGRDCKLIAPSS